MSGRGFIDPVCFLWLAAVAGAAAAESSMGMAGPGEGASASASVRINVIVHPNSAVRLSAAGLATSGNARHASTCELRYVDAAHPPAPSATLHGLPCRARWVAAGNGPGDQPAGVLTSSQP